MKMFKWLLLGLSLTLLAQSQTVTTVCENTIWVLTCPQCGVATEETMPTEVCQFFYECGHCKAVLRPKPGDCSVFCCYGSVKCPPVQA